VAHAYNSQEAEFRRIAVPSQPRRIVHRDPNLKNPSQKIGLVEWLKVKALSSSPSTAKTKTETKQKIPYLTITPNSKIQF
jgi:hypothetical protein